jgi:sulfite exporter TauE/SafE
MQTPLALTALAMGLAGGPHCIAMCGAACGGIGSMAGAPAGRLQWRFHAGRVMGYATLGAVAAASVQGLAWFTSQTGALRPVWTFFHVMVLSWGLILLAAARQPVWVQDMGRAIWSRMQAVMRRRGGVLLMGGLWAFMPCGLLYSALLVSALGASPVDGAISMTMFAAGTTLSLTAGPWLWQRLRLKLRNEAWGMRLAGLLLSLTAGWAIWMDLAHSVKLWCA